MDKKLIYDKVLVPLDAKNLLITLDTTQFEAAICKANELLDTINKAKTLANDLAYMLRDLNFTPSVGEIPEDAKGWGE